jgi:RHS repeat-associated protein
VLAFSLLSATVGAHDCVQLKVDLKKGETLADVLIIEADVSESEDTEYTVTPFNADVVDVTPLTLTAFNGVFSFEGVGAGTTAVTILWSYEPNNAEGFCTVTVNVAAPESSGSTPAAGNAAEPVNTFNGELYFTERPDLFLDGPMPLYFERYFASYLRRSFILGDLGNNWLHNYDHRFRWNGTRALYSNHRGRLVTFDNVGGNWVQQDQLDVPYQLDIEPGQDVRLYDPSTELVYSFDYTTGGAVTGRLVRVQDGKGNEHVLAYNGGGRLQSVTDGLGRTLTFTYNADFIPKIASVSDGIRTVLFQYDDVVDEENLTSFIDARGNSTSYVYKDTSGTADRGLLLSRQRPEGNFPYSQTYHDPSEPLLSGRVKTQIDGLGNVTTLDYDVVAGVTDITDPLSNTKTHQHDSSGRLTSHTGEDGGVISIGYDGAGRRSGIVDGLGDSTSQQFHAPSGEVASITDAEGNTTQYTYTGREAGGMMYYDLTRIDYADGAFEQFTFDADGNQLTHRDVRGNVFSWTYNTRGQILSAMNRTGAATLYEYDGAGRMVSVTTAGGDEFLFDYDALNRTSMVTFPDSSTRLYSYDANDNITSTTDERGNTTTYTYDRNNNLTKVTRPLGHQTTYEYDAMDRFVTKTDPLGNTWERTYSPLGQVTSVTDPTGRVTQLEYDEMQNLRAVTDPGANSWNFAFNGEGELETIHYPGGGTWSATYNRMGRPESLTTPLGSTTSYRYDTQSQLQQITRADGRLTTFTRDAAGFLDSVDQAGIASNYSRNPLSLITRVVDPVGDQWVRAYDAQGRVTSVTDPAGNQTVITYDQRSRVDQVTFPDSLGTLAASYDETNNLTRRLFSDGLDIVYTYDARDQLLTAPGLAFVYDAAGQPTEINGFKFDYDAAGRLTSTEYAPGKVVSYTYDARGKLESVTDWLGNQVSFVYDAEGRPLTLARSNGIDTQFTYDLDGRLIHIAAGTLGTTAISLDSVGRKLGVQRTAPQTIEPAAIVNQTHVFGPGSRETDYGYDALGRLLNDNVRQYEWDLASRLVEISQDGQQTTFTYDGLGARTGRTRPGESLEYLWNYGLTLPSMAVIKRNGVEDQYFVHTPDGRLLFRIGAGNAVEFYHYDEMGNTLFLTDGSGNLTSSYTYSPYGVLLGGPQDDGNPFVWQGIFGVMREGNDGLYYLRARYYNAQQGRFLSPDLFDNMLPFGNNPYQYGFGDPKLHVDPTGLSAAVAFASSHSEIEVDVWDGDTVIGVINVSFQAKGYVARKGVLGMLQDLAENVVSDGEFKVSWEPASKRTICGRKEKTHSSKVFLDGSKAQDEQLLAAMLNGVGMTLEEVRQRATEEALESGSNPDTATVNFPVTGTGDWDHYSWVTQSCNDWTDAMLDVYFGENWNYWPQMEATDPTIPTTGLVANLREYLRQKPYSCRPSINKLCKWAQKYHRNWLSAPGSR